MTLEALKWQASCELLYFVYFFFTPPPDRGAKYCYDRVCLSVCLSVREHISGTTRPIFTNFFVRVTSGRFSVLLCRRSDTLRISGFVDDVIFGHKLRLLDVAARLMQ